MTRILNALAVLALILCSSIIGAGIALFLVLVVFPALV